MASNHFARSRRAQLPSAENLNTQHYRAGPIPEYPQERLFGFPREWFRSLRKIRQNGCVFEPTRQKIIFSDPDRMDYKELMAEIRAQQKGTILIVEDEEHFREFSAAVLERVGFKVFQASDGKQAAQIWKEEQSSIDLLFADVLIPGLSGVDVVTDFLRVRPDLKVIFTSGNDREVVIETAHFVKGAKFLRKPYSTDVLVDAVRSALSESRKSR